MSLCLMTFLRSQVHIIGEREKRLWILLQLLAAIRLGLTYVQRHELFFCWIAMLFFIQGLPFGSLGYFKTKFSGRVFQTPSQLPTYTEFPYNCTKLIIFCMMGHCFCISIKLSSWGFEWVTWILWHRNRSENLRTAFLSLKALAWQFTEAILERSHWRGNRRR